MEQWQKKNLSWSTNLWLRFAKQRYEPLHGIFGFSKMPEYAATDWNEMTMGPPPPIRIPSYRTYKSRNHLFSQKKTILPIFL
jgi:hypothetical protein